MSSHATATDVPPRTRVLNWQALLLAGARGGRRGHAGGLLEAVGAAELLAEPLHAAGGVDELLLAREERVAVAADVDRQPALRAAGRERVAAGAMHGADLVLGVDLLLHVYRSLRRACVARQCNVSQSCSKRVIRLPTTRV